MTMAAFGQREALRVVRGRASDDELAGLVAALYALSNNMRSNNMRGEPEPEKPAEPTPLRRRWRYRSAVSWRSKAAS